MLWGPGQKLGYEHNPSVTVKEPASPKGKESELDGKGKREPRGLSVCSALGSVLGILAP